jgi:hypothetical protein
MNVRAGRVPAAPVALDEVTSFNSIYHRDGELDQIDRGFVSSMGE